MSKFSLDFIYTEEDQLAFGINRNGNLFIKNRNASKEYSEELFNKYLKTDKKPTTGYIPVEINFYKKLVDKAEKYDKIMEYVNHLGGNHAES